MIGYIYPQWLKAKKELGVALKLDNEQWKILDEWFRRHCFEFGSDTLVIDEPGRDIQSIDKEERYCSARKLCDMIIEKNLFFDERTYRDFNGMKAHNLRRTVLVFGVPTAVGPAEREIL